MSRAMIRACCALLLLLLSVGCAQEMDNQRRVQPQERAAFFSDGLATRPLPEHVVAFNDAISDDPGYLTGSAGGEPLAAPPENVLERLPGVELLQRGRARFGVYCAPCHDPTGSGNGMVPRRGFTFPPTYHSNRLRSKPLGYFFAIATEGKGRMPPLGDQIAVDDRWAIAAYVRALQLSEFAPRDVLNDADFQQLRGEP